MATAPAPHAGEGVGLGSKTVIPGATGANALGLPWTDRPTASTIVTSNPAARRRRANHHDRGTVS